MIGGYSLGALALLPALFANGYGMLTYALGNWLGLSAWGAVLAHEGQPGFRPSWKDGGTFKRWADKLALSQTLFHWFTALPLGLWVWALFGSFRPLDWSYPLALSALAWGMVSLSYRLKRVNSQYYRVWHGVGLAVSLGGIWVALQGLPQSIAFSLNLVSAGLLFAADSAQNRRGLMLAFGGLLGAAGLARFLSYFDVSSPAIVFGVAALTSLYILGGLEIERRKSKRYTAQYLMPLYGISHGLSVLILFSIYIQPFIDCDWWSQLDGYSPFMGGRRTNTTGYKLWLFCLGAVSRPVAYIAAWLGAGGAGLYCHHL